jgi:hypothetical protein
MPCPINKLDKSACHPEGARLLSESKDLAILRCARDDSHGWISHLFSPFSACQPERVAKGPGSGILRFADSLRMTTLAPIVASWWVRSEFVKMKNSQTLGMTTCTLLRYLRDTTLAEPAVPR